MRYPPMPSEFHNREPPPPVQNFRFFLEVDFRLSNGSMNKRTWIYASSRLWSSGARRQALLFSDKENLMLVASWVCKLFLSLNLAIKINTTYGSFTPLCFLVLFWCLQSKITQIQTVKIFWRAKYCWVFDFSSLRPFICHVVCTKSVLNPYASCSVHEYLIIWQAFEGPVWVFCSLDESKQELCRAVRYIIFLDFIHVTRN